VNHFLVNGSGDIYYNSPSDNEVSVNLQNSSGKIFAKTKISNSAICGSGTEKRNWSIKNTDNLHHIIDANTNRPTKNISNVWIKVKSEKLPTTFADALATAIFFIEPETLQQKTKEILNLDFEYLIIPTDPNKKILVSKNFDADFLN
jgi:thiamine biosynthesis lipoprotein ApbE